MSRKKFIESHGATCRNWMWSWSFINEKEKTIIFGAWDMYRKEHASMIMSEDWERRTPGGRRRSGYGQSMEHLSLVAKGYQLKIFHMDFLGDKKDGSKAAKIKKFEAKLRPKTLVKRGCHYFACDGNTISDEDFEYMDKRSAARHGRA